MRSLVRSTLLGAAERTSGNETRVCKVRAGFSMGLGYTTVTAAPSGSETPLVKTTTPICTQPEISLC
jgi:hypothetical protein